MPISTSTRIAVQRVLPIVGGYLAGGWALLQFVSWASERYAIAPGIVDVLTGVWLACLPAVVLIVMLQKPRDRAVEVRAAAPGSVAVLPFANRSSGNDDVFLSEGISEELITALARVNGLRVAARTSSFAFKDKQMVAGEIGRALNVRHLLEGSVQRIGQQLRVTTQLVNADDGFQLWSGKWDAQMGDVFAIEDEIADNVVRALGTVLDRDLDESTARVPRANIRAYEQYLRGRQFYRQTRKRSLGFARELFRSAIALDPSYATAYAALADSITLELMYYPTSDADIGEADRASASALEFDPHLPEAHSARACVLFQLGKYSEAESEFKTALELNVRLFDAWYFYARMCFQLGRFEEAARLFERATNVREDFQASFFAAQTHEALGHSERARQLYQSALDVVTRYMELNPDDPRAATMRSTALMRLDRREEALTWAARAVAIDPEDAGVRYNVACTYTLAGELEKAVACLEDAVRVGFGNRGWLERDPDLNALRGDPRFESLLQAM